jgi:hypothetical protein
VTETVPAALVQLFTVVVTLYVPLLAEVSDPRTGFCNTELNEPGPLQL